ncbi:type II secretion system protein E [Gemmatirosa kalamazoonensis]|uniref:Type II secretion system protein E n=1 Tax=Gemmatirosa kalamazoonensis TaxID=861299 RepID=W0RNM7_9BACT|nr:GspE/PulE family protein [Gemmatirosa kalamazoonensis]AHG91940.1 type II secretion system protein E [Gemmatirosa kalamazoonensis]
MPNSDRVSGLGTRDSGLGGGAVPECRVPSPESRLPTRDLRAAAQGDLAASLPAAWLAAHLVLPLGIADDGALLVAAAGTPDPTVRDELARRFGRRLRLVDAPAAELEAALLAARPEAAVDVAVDGDAEYDDASGDLRALANQAPVVRLVNVLLLDALRLGASDVHLESTADGLRVRYRLDGVLQDVERVPPSLRAGVVSRVKILAGLDVAERRLPQDGRARVRVGDAEVDLRASTLPALHGESVVLRVLDHGGGGARDLAALGMPDAVRAPFERLLGRAGGLLLVTGPTGSGKTTTLYAALRRVATPGVKVVTVEDPVEYRLPGAVQIPTNTRAGLGFADALRSILRHDPDVVMVGETRDRETAEIAVQAALTGHLVFTTLHTVDAPSAVTRLVDMGIEPYLVAATVQGVLAQRLVRLVCDSCSESTEAPPALHALRSTLVVPTGESERGAWSVERGGAESWRRGRGCDACAGSGYRGRTGIYELLVVDEAFRALVVSHAPLDALRERARAAGMVPLLHDGLRLARAGLTTVEEVLRVAGDAA